MRLVIFDRPAGRDASPAQLGLLTPDGVVAVDLLPAPTAGAALKRAITEFDGLRAQFDDLAAHSVAVPLDECRLLAPLASPAKILCTLNLPMQHTDTNDELHVFLKATGSTIGDGGEVVLPRLEGAELFTHSARLAVVIGKRCRDIATSDWREVVFGYTAMVDITARTATLARWREGLSALGSSCDTFGPLGPAIVPRADVEERDGLYLELRCGGELRQHIAFDDLDDQVGTAIQRAASVMTLHPGDVIAVDGAAGGQGPVQDGDELQVDISQVGRLRTYVRDPWHRDWDRTIRVASGVGSAGE